MFSTIKSAALKKSIYMRRYREIILAFNSEACMHGYTLHKDFPQAQVVGWPSAIMTSQKLAFSTDLYTLLPFKVIFPPYSIMNFMLLQPTFCLKSILMSMQIEPHLQPL